MRSGLMKRFGMGTTVVTLVLAWAVVPPSQAQPQLTEAERALAPVPADAPAQTPARVTPAWAAPQSPPNPAVRRNELAAVRPDRTSESAPVRNDDELVMRKPRHEMDDAEMDGVSGGITGSFDMTQSGNMVLNDNSVQSISLSDQAQQNLSSLVNILSINSTIQVMMNLNVNINSTVGTVNQGNTGTQNTGVQNTITP